MNGHDMKEISGGRDRHGKPKQPGIVSWERDTPRERSGRSEVSRPDVKPVDASVPQGCGFAASAGEQRVDRQHVPSRADRWRSFGQMVLLLGLGAGLALAAGAAVVITVFRAWLE